MDSKEVHLNNLKQGERYKILLNNNKVYSGVFDKKINAADNEDISVLFNNSLDETTEPMQNLASLTVMNSFVKKYYIPISSFKGPIERDIARKISKYGGKNKSRKTTKRYKKTIKKVKKRKLNKKYNKTKSTKKNGGNPISIIKYNNGSLFR